MNHGKFETIKMLTYIEWGNLDTQELIELQGKGGGILYDKLGGMTSYDVVSQIRKRLTQACGKKVKVGHAGTLDPLATGLLIILVGPAVKRQSDYMDMEKEYECVAWMGLSSDTYDVDGKCQFVRGVDFQLLERNVSKFVGKIVQETPAYSAVKMGGQKLYELARQGKLGLRRLPLRNVEVMKFEVKGSRILARELCKKVTDVDSSMVLEVDLRFVVSSGTYIRSLVHEWGKSVNSDGIVYKLRRVRIGGYFLGQ